MNIYHIDNLLNKDFTRSLSLSLSLCVCVCLPIAIYPPIHPSIYPIIFPNKICIINIPTAVTTSTSAILTTTPTAMMWLYVNNKLGVLESKYLKLSRVNYLKHTHTHTHTRIHTWYSIRTSNNAWWCTWISARTDWWIHLHWDYEMLQRQHSCTHLWPLPSVNTFNVHITQKTQIATLWDQRNILFEMYINFV